MISIAKKTKEIDENDQQSPIMKNKDSCEDCSLQTVSDPEKTTAKRRWAKFFKMFRSKSDGCMKASANQSSPKEEKCVSASDKPRRRFLRVEHDDKAQPPEVVSDNPHVIYKYSQTYLQEHYEKSSGDWTNRPLPYSTSGHTILKKSSTDPNPSSAGNTPNNNSPNISPSCSKHATFKEVVEVHEYSGQDVVNTELHIMSEAKLYDDDDEEEEEEGSLDASDDTEKKKGGFFLENDDDNDVTYEKDDDRSAELKKLRLDLCPDENFQVKDVDIDRVDGVRKNIFSAMGNPNSVDGIAKARSEPAKRVKLAELILQDTPKGSKSDAKIEQDGKSELSAKELKKRAKLAQSSKKEVSKDSSHSRRHSKAPEVEVCYDFAC